MTIVNTLRKEVALSGGKGLLLTDPSYEKGTWCRYDADVDLEGWRLEYEAQDRTEDGYSLTDFAVVLTRKDSAPIIDIRDNMSSFAYPPTLEVKETLLGMDTACMYIGPSIEFDPDEWQPDCALSTGTDGEFGAAYELTDKDGIAAIVVFGWIDARFGTSETVWDYLKDTFKITE